MEFYSVHSHFIKSVGYDESIQKVYVNLQSNEVCSFPNVTREEFDGFFQAWDKDAYYTFVFKKITQKKISKN
jgi:hypothetical protein